MKTTTTVMDDAELEAGLLPSAGDVVSWYTATRAVRGTVLGVRDGWMLLGDAAVVWDADPAGVNQGPSRYFAPGPVQGVSEEALGPKTLVYAQVAAGIYWVRHREFSPLPRVDASPLRVGDTVWACTYSHEFRGEVDAVGESWLRLRGARMVNEVEQGRLGAVLSDEAARGEDDVKMMVPVTVALGACPLVLVRR